MAEESKSHWDELARQLGLEPKADPKAPPAFHERAPSMPSEPVTHAPEPIAEAEEPAPEFEEAALPEEVGEPAELLDESPADGISEELEIVDFTMAETVSESEEAAPEPKRRRGRRARSGRGRETEASSTDDREAAAPSDSASADEASEQPRGRRGRGRGRRKKDRSDEGAAVTSDAAVDTEIAPAPEEDDNEEIDNLSDWNVPSWQELIASLYRPER